MPCSKKNLGEAIPPGATLKFEVEVVDIPGSKQSSASNGIERNIFDECDGDSDGLLTRDEIAAWIVVNSPHGQAKRPSMQELDQIWHRDDHNKVI